VNPEAPRGNLSAAQFFFISHFSRNQKTTPTTKPNQTTKPKNKQAKAAARRATRVAAPT
jgi:hypothetical protein